MKYRSSDECPSSSSSDVSACPKSGFVGFCTGDVLAGGFLAVCSGDGIVGCFSMFIACVVLWVVEG